jgi:hypothetical protein
LYKLLKIEHMIDYVCIRMGEGTIWKLECVKVTLNNPFVALIRV